MTVASKLKTTLASLKGCQGTLKVYGKQSRDDETRTVFTEAIEVLSLIINDLEKREQTLEYQEPQYKGN